MARAFGSYPTGRWFKSDFRYQGPLRQTPWPVGQEVKTPPFHGSNGSSILPRVTKKRDAHLCISFFALVPRGSNRTPFAVGDGVRIPPQAVSCVVRTRMKSFNFACALKTDENSRTADSPTLLQKECFFRFAVLRTDANFLLCKQLNTTVFAYDRHKWSIAARFNDLLTYYVFVMFLRSLARYRQSRYAATAQGGILRAWSNLKSLNCAKCHLWRQLNAVIGGKKSVVSRTYKRHTEILVVFCYNIGKLVI